MTVLENALAVNDGKAVVISIKREWLSKIMAGEKTLEVRKSRPWEISFPFAVFCYETKANGGAGEIIGAFTCEDIDQLNCLTGLSPYYADGEKRYILHPRGLNVGETIISGTDADIKPGNALPLSAIPVGTLVHAVELQPGRGAALARSAGTSIQLMGKEGDYAILRMPSSEMRRVLVTCRATVGEVGNAEHSNIKIGKAGRNRWKGIRPSVRGTVMNPVDHPHGGGEGKNKSSGRHPVTPWGVPTKGHRTRNPKKASSRLIIRRRKK